METFWNECPQQSDLINTKNELVSVVKQELEVVSQFAKGLMASYFPIMFG
jgi:hypothetical protein